MAERQRARGSGDQAEWRRGRERRGLVWRAQRVACLEERRGALR